MVGAVRPPPGRAGADHSRPGTLDHRPARLLHADQRGTGAEHHPNGHRRRGGPDRGAAGGRPWGTAFGTAQGDALAALQDKLGAPGERRSWASAQTPFGTCPGPVRAARWGRLYVLFTSGRTRYRPGGGWHLFAYQVDAVQRSVLDGQYSGPAPHPTRRRCVATARGPGPASGSGRRWPSCGGPTATG